MWLDLVVPLLGREEEEGRDSVPLLGREEKEERDSVPLLGREEGEERDSARRTYTDDVGFEEEGGVLK